MRTKWSGEVIAFVDALLALTVVLLALTILVQPTHKAEADPAAAPPGAMTIELRWDRSADDDVDLWIKPPGGVSVGYSNKVGPGIALLRDDLGPGADADSINDELAQANILRQGEYIVNAHLYRARTKPPIQVTLIVKVRRDGRYYEIAREHGVLAAEGQEITLIRFTLDKEGNIIRGLTNQLPIHLRAQ